MKSIVFFNFIIIYISSVSSFNIFDFVKDKFGFVTEKYGVEQISEEGVYIPPKDILPGCARFYISEPIANSGTQYW